MTDDPTHNVFGTYCGDNRPKTFTFMNNVMMIFMTDSTLGKKGFEIHYELQGKIQYKALTKIILVIFIIIMDTCLSQKIMSEIKA